MVGDDVHDDLQAFLVGFSDIFLVLGIAASLTVVVLHTFTANGTKLFLSSLLGKLLLSLVCAAVLCHTVNSLNAEACCEDSHLHLVAEGWIEGETPFDFEVAAELGHEVVDIVHLVHHQS